MALETILGALDAIEPFGAILAIAGSISGTAALIKSVAAFKKTREFKEYMARERSHNMESVSGVLHGCLDAIATILDMRDAEMYYRSLAAVSHLLQGSLLQREEYIAHDARRLVPALLTQLLAASTVRHRRSAVLLEAASRQVVKLLDNVESPPQDPR